MPGKGAMPTRYLTFRQRARVFYEQTVSLHEKKKMPSNAQKRIVLLCYIRFKRDARSALCNCFLSADRKR